MSQYSCPEEEADDIEAMAQEQADAEHEAEVNAAGEAEAETEAMIARDYAIRLKELKEGLIDILYKWVHTKGNPDGSGNPMPIDEIINLFRKYKEAI
jgi:hypothetical protein